MQDLRPVSQHQFVRRNADVQNANGDGASQATVTQMKLWVVEGFDPHMRASQSLLRQQHVSE